LTTVTSASGDDTAQGRIGLELFERHHLAQRMELPPVARIAEFQNGCGQRGKIVHFWLAPR
jgi:hypothetical protein